MVRLKGPGLAESAAGGLGKTLIFAESKGRAYVKHWAKPKNPQSQKQNPGRAITAYLTKRWGTMGTGYKATWNALAAQTNIPAYNAFMSYNIERFTRFHMPTVQYPATETGSGGSIKNKTTTVNGHRVTLTWEPNVISDNWGYIIYHKLGSAPTSTWIYTVALIAGGSLGVKTYVAERLPSGTHYWRLDSFSTTGALTGIAESFIAVVA